MKARLNTGHFKALATDETTSENEIVKEAVLVYEGKFQSMDGEVDITEDVMMRIADNHNSGLKKLSESLGMKRYPPIQLDHSTSAKDTVGRLIGDLSLGEHALENGSKVKCLKGQVKILGKENVERIKDGRWTHLSIGADLETGKLTELTITPFPAAPEASLLSKMSKQIYRGCVIETKEVGGGRWNAIITIDGDTGEMPFKAKSNADALREAKEVIDEWLSEDENLSKKHLAQNITYKGFLITLDHDKKIGQWIAEVSDQIFKEAQRDLALNKAKKWVDDNEDKLKKGDDEMTIQEMKEKVAMYEKCKAHLMDHEKMSEEDTEKKLSEMTPDEMKKMSDEHDEKMKKLAEEEDKKKKEMADKEAQEKLEQEAEMSRLSKSVEERKAKVARLQKKQSIQKRLSVLKAKGKITPAEIKKINLSQIIDLDDKATDVVLGSIEAREPQILAGVMGSASAVNMAKIMEKVRLEALEKETLANMSFTGAALKKMSEGESETKIHIDTTPHTHIDGDGLAALMKMLQEGKVEEAMKKLKGMMDGEGEADLGGEDVEETARELAEESKHLQTEQESIVRLTKASGK